MNTRLLLFLMGCMGTRFGLVYLAKTASTKWLKYMGYLALLPACGFLYIYLTGSRTGPGVFGEKIWWNSIRPVHSLFYFLFAYSAVKGIRGAWIYLWMDVLFGLSMFWVNKFNLI